ncbi:MULTISPECIES: hypothetical protein [Rhodomicrobium]|uniref:hypothetical protein n=1 Tax=Rhodomicrobium TaxID=1068 RepID=UPI000B4BA454|nr:MULTISPECIES: hypothetical protein [Rhodomicrobium]
MNTANLQLQGMLLALASLLEAMKRKGLMTQAEIETALYNAEAEVSVDTMRPPELSPANVDAICFPIRFLRVATGKAGQQTFAEIATGVGRTKPGRCC